MAEEKKDQEQSQNQKNPDCHRIFNEILDLIDENEEWVSRIVAAIAFVLGYHELIDIDQAKMLANRDFNLMEFVDTFKPEDTDNDTETVGKA